MMNKLAGIGLALVAVGGMGGYHSSAVTISSVTDPGLFFALGPALLAAMGVACFVALYAMRQDDGQSFPRIRE